MGMVKQTKKCQPKKECNCCDKTEFECECQCECTEYEYIRVPKKVHKADCGRPDCGCQEHVYQDCGCQDRGYEKYEYVKVPKKYEEECPCKKEYPCACEEKDSSKKEEKKEVKTGALVRCGFGSTTSSIPLPTVTTVPSIAVVSADTSKIKNSCTIVTFSGLVTVAPVASAGTLTIALSKIIGCCSTASINIASYPIIIPAIAAGVASVTIPFSFQVCDNNSCGCCGDGCTTYTLTATGVTTASATTALTGVTISNTSITALTASCGC